jgi:hypothetical protein
LTEEQLFGELFAHCGSYFKSMQLRSHDQNHPARVWKYSKDYVEIFLPSFASDREFMVSLLFASMFHDVGMVFDISETHGKVSEQLFRNYYAQTCFQQELLSRRCFENICEAIHLHDRKESVVKHTDNYILQIISVADDLDAYGLVGAVRYIEIYGMRGIPPQEIPKRVLLNVGKRFERFEELCSSQALSSFYTTHRNRFEILIHFFSRAGDPDSGEAQLMRHLIENRNSCCWVLEYLESYR